MKRIKRKVGRWYRKNYVKILEVITFLFFIENLILIFYKVLRDGKLV